MNNFLINWFLFIITIKLVLFLYKISKLYLNKLNVFSYDIETLVLLNGKTIHYLRFRNVNSVPNWPDKYFNQMLQVVIYYLSDHYKNYNTTYISITFFVYFNNSNIYKNISDTCIINYTESRDENVFINLITLDDFAFNTSSNNNNNDNNDIVVIIKDL